MNIRLWFTGQETELGRLYSRIPSSRHPQNCDKLWVPKSICEHTSKQPAKHGEDYPEHILTLPDWFIEKEKL